MTGGSGHSDQSSELYTRRILLQKENYEAIIIDKLDGVELRRINFLVFHNSPNYDNKILCV